jgi:hypothetical protein
VYGQTRLEWRHGGNHYRSVKNFVLYAGNLAVTTLNGRALSLIASVTMVNTVIKVP